MPSMSSPHPCPIRYEAWPVKYAPEIAVSDMREVNQKLLLAVLSAQDRCSVAETALQRQLETLTVLAHELRNGLTPIQSAADLLERVQSLDEPLLTRLHGVIDRNTSHLSRLIADLIEGSHVSTGRFRLETCLIDLLENVRQSAASCLPAMVLRSQQITVNTPPGTLLISADPVRLTQIFVNLLVNASKYTPVGGSISISVALRSRFADVSVSDNGIGISAEALPHVFEMFVRDAPRCTPHASGFGVGLAVVRELVQAHGGTVCAESAGPDCGSKFTATFPIEAPRSV